VNLKFRTIIIYEILYALFNAVRDYGWLWLYLGLYLAGHWHFKIASVPPVNTFYLIGTF
jgi:hypothetical protein